jgi:hypothetical protein
MRKLNNLRPRWHAKYATMREVATAGLVAPFPYTSRQEDGQLGVSVYIEPGQADRQVYEKIDQFIDNILSAFGQKRYYQRISEDGASLREYRVEYFNIHHAGHAFTCLDNLLLDVRILLLFYRFSTDVHFSLCDLVLPSDPRTRLFQVIELRAWDPPPAP